MVMSIADQIQNHQERCQPHLLRLRMLARGDDEPALAAAQADQATSAILTEVEAAIQAALATNGAVRRRPADKTFLRVRLDRLAVAAEQVVAAAREEDTAGLRHHVRRFEALTSASWTVQHAVYDPAPSPRRRSRPRISPSPDDAALPVRP
jgi:hypothetical protein